MRKITKIITNQRMRYHLDRLLEDNDLNKLDKNINKDQEQYSSELIDESSKVNILPKGTTNKSRPRPIGKLNIRQTSSHKITVLHEGLKVLYDSGCSHTMIRKDYTNHCKRLRSNKKEQTFITAAGAFVSAGKAIVEFSLPDLNDSKVIKWPCYLDDANDMSYDVIIGRDLMTKLGISIDFKRKVIQWDDIELPMQERKVQPKETNVIMQ